MSRTKTPIFFCIIRTKMPATKWADVNRIAARIAEEIYGSKQEPKIVIKKPDLAACLTLFETEEDKKLAKNIYSYFEKNGQYRPDLYDCSKVPPIAFKVKTYLEAHKFEPSLVSLNITLFPGLYLPGVNVSHVKFFEDNWLVVESKANQNTVGQKCSSQPSIQKSFERSSNRATQGILEINDFFTVKKPLKRKRKGKKNPPSSSLFNYGFSHERNGQNYLFSDNSENGSPNTNQSIYSTPEEPISYKRRRVVLDEPLESDESFIPETPPSQCSSPVIPCKFLLKK
ncbi:MAG: hypothetical protein ABIH77_02660 [Pseudomonadota bacterium]